MAKQSVLTVSLAVLTAFVAFPPPADARAETGTKLENVEMKTLSGGREKLLSPKVKANVFVFFRTNQERSLDALKQMATCEKDLAGKSIHWAAVVSSTEPTADVEALVKQTGIRMPVLIDEGDALYEKLEIRLHPIVGIADGAGVLQALEPYRQIEYCNVIKTRIKVLLGEATVADVDKLQNPDKSPLPGADPMKKAMRDVNMARKLYDIGQYATAVQFAQRAIAVAPVAHAYTVMGQAYVKLAKCDEATKALDQAVKLDPKEAEMATAARAGCK